MQRNFDSFASRGPMRPVQEEFAGNKGELALIAMQAEALEPVSPATKAEQLPNIVGALMPRHGNVQVFYERYKCSASIQIPGAGTFYMDFQNILGAEDKLVAARRDANDEAFSKLLYRDYIEPLRPIIIEGDSRSHAYRYAGSPIYDKGWFDDVWCGCSFAIPIWDGDQMTNLLIIDGGKLWDVVLEPNPHMTNPKSPKWTGKVKAS
ncbi:hypothetical protein ASF09_04060 [Sphingomonas sp. Leaf242]|nr:hypothetical protein ASF09_04060 [Sphingomonas sp. Leaf242]